LGGQEDMLIDIAVKLADERRGRAGVTDERAADLAARLDEAWRLRAHRWSR
jgi:hypothetical protein